MSDTDTYLEAVVLPIGEVARLVGVSIPTVRNWDRAGKIHSFRTPGGQRRFPMSEIERIRAERAA